jgi:glycosyltransferase involved in cell wall biosynthesis
VNETPAVSIIVSTYNRASVIGPALRAILEDQQAGDLSYEVIVVDNNSSDDTARVLEAFAQRHPGMRWLSEPRQGVSHGRNAGIRAALSPLLAFTDDDIRIARDWVATIKRLMDDHPEVDCIGGPVLPIWQTRPPSWLDVRHWGPTSVTDYGPRPFEISAAHPRCLLTSNLVMRKEVFSKIGMFSPRFPRGQDHELQLRYWLAGGRALYSPHLVVHTEVPAARMTKAYHRRWHQVNGAVCARMWLRERSTPEGGLRPDPLVRRVFLGVPGFLFRELKTEVRGWLAAVGGPDPGETFARELAVRHLVGYIAERRREASRREHRAPSDAQLGEGVAGPDARIPDAAVTPAPCSSSCPRAAYQDGDSLPSS